MKKALVLTLVLALAFSMFACSANTEPASEATQAPAQTDARTPLRAKRN